MDLSPQSTYYCEHSTLGRIKKSPRWDNDEGVAATVGTIMALLVFLTFMGMFTNQFVPVWMSDNESTHMSQAVQQFITLKSQIDIAVSNNPNSRIAPTPIFVPVTLSASGIPIFAGPTAGVLTFTPESISVKPTFNITYRYMSDAGGTPTYYVLDSSTDGGSGGDLDLYCPNRYYVEQHLTYEAGAVILNQTDGEFVIAGLQISVRNLVTGTSETRVMMITQVSLDGTNKTIGGTGSKGVNADLKYADTKTYENNAGSNVTVSVVSRHGIAWENYFNSTLKTLFNLTYGTDFEIHKKHLVFPADNSLNYYQVWITVKDVKLLEHTHATVWLSIGELGI